MQTSPISFTSHRKGMSTMNHHCYPKQAELEGLAALFLHNEWRHAVCIHGYYVEEVVTKFNLSNLRFRRHNFGFVYDFNGV